MRVGGTTSNYKRTSVSTSCQVLLSNTPAEMRPSMTILTSKSAVICRRWFLSEHDGRCRAIIIEIAPSRPFTSFLCSARLQSASVGCVHFDRWRRRRITFCWSEPIFVRNHLHFTKLHSYNVHYLKLAWCDIFQKRKCIEESNESLDSAKSMLALATFPIK